MDSPLQTIRIILLDGVASGIKIGEILGRPVQGIVCPRDRVSELKETTYGNRPCVYFLFGDEDGEKKAYIGEAENMFERLKDHDAKKEFWTEVVFFVSVDSYLNKAHVKFLESHILKISKETKRYIIDQPKNAKEASLHISDQAEMGRWLVNIKLILGVFSRNILEEKIPSNNQNATKLEITLTQAGLKAKAVKTDEGVCVLKGSHAALEKKSLAGGYANLRERLITQGTLTKTGNKFTFSEDFMFDSSSAAGAIIVGHNISGPQNWKDASGKTLKEIEVQKLK